MADLSVKYPGLDLKSPVVASSSGLPAGSKHFLFSKQIKYFM